MLALLTAITVRDGFPAGSLSALAPGTDAVSTDVVSGRVLGRDSVAQVFSGLELLKDEALRVAADLPVAGRCAHPRAAVSGVA
jgi:hypothetical protein